MRIIHNDEIDKLQISPAELLAWVDETLRHKAESVLPPKIHLVPGEGCFMNVMPTLLPWLGHAGCKIVNRYPGRRPALHADLLLYDLHTGDTRALFEADSLTALRTGAVAAHSMCLLAKQKPQTLALIGLGRQMQEAIRIYLGVWSGGPLEIRLLRYKDQAERFRAWLLEQLPSGMAAELHFCILDEPWALVAGADIVVSAPTYLEDDLLPPEAFGPGTLLVPIHTRGFMACDLAFDRIYGDDRGHLEGFRHFAQYRCFAEVADVLREPGRGRRSDDERILVYNIGLAIHDVAFAVKMGERLGL